MRLGTKSALALGTVAIAMAVWLGRSEIPAVRAAGPCTSDSERARFVLQEFLATDPGVLAAVGLAGVDPDSVQIVTTNNSCTKLRNELKSDYPVRGGEAAWSPVYYQASDRYIVVLLRNVDPNDTIAVAGYSPVLVYDDAFNRMETFAS